MVVVYKVDRLSRSLLDFAKLLALFDEQHVGFASTTQHFNTRDAMGRLTLNIVVSFAQFEREMIADRTRDKIWAARKRGKWLGSRPPLGYRGDREAMRLVVDQEEAEQVRRIFQLYVHLESATEVALELNALGWERKRTTTRGGKVVGGGPWDEKEVHKLLRNPVYLGLVDFRGERYEGEHEAIIELVLFDEVQRALDVKPCGRGPRRGRNPAFLLQGLLRCGLCAGPMTTASARGRGGATFRYYLCRHLRTKSKGGGATCRQPRLAAPEIEAAVVTRVRGLCADSGVRAAVAAHVAAAQPAWVAKVQAQRTEVAGALRRCRAEGRKLIRDFGGKAKGQTSALLAERIVELEDEAALLEARLAGSDRELKAAQQAAALVEQRVGAVALFDQAWAEMRPDERQRLVRLLVEEVVIDAIAGRLEIGFHLPQTPSITKDEELAHG